MSDNIKFPFGVGQNDGTDKTSVNVGTANTGVTAVEYGDAVNHTTSLSFTALSIGTPITAANLAFGKLLYTMPAGVQIVEAVYMSVALTGTTTIVGDTPDVGVGSVIASGAQATLSGAGATMEDYVTGQTSGAISGSNTSTVLAVATAGALTGIALNVAASAKTFHLNVADGWAGAGTVTATGTVVIVWKTLA
jgi:hypothetical protein